MATVRENLGEAVNLGHPVVLDRPGTMWFVDEGLADIFSAELKDGQPVGRRVHLLRVHAGEAFFATGPEVGERAICLLATVVPGARLRQVQLAELATEVADPASLPNLAGLVDQWVGALTGHLTRSVPPNRFVTLSPDQPATLTTGAIGRSYQVVWVRHTAGSSRWLERPDVLLTPESAYFPLSQLSWVQALENAEIEVTETVDLLAAGSLWSALEAFHQQVLQAVMSNREALLRAEQERLGKRIKSDQSFTSTALSDLVGSMQSDTATQVAPREEEEPLLAACRLVIEALGGTMVGPPDSQLNRVRDPVQRIAQSSNLRVRQVFLQGEWWKSDSGPLLAFTGEGQQPVALLPRSPGSYTLIDPVKGAAVSVSPSIAHSLGPHAYMFYTPLPARALTAMDLVTYGQRGLWRSDLRAVVLMGIGAGVISAFVPYATGLLFDAIIPEAQRGQLLQMILLLLVTAFAATLFELTRAVAVMRIEGRLDGSIQAAIWDRVLRLPVPFFRLYNAGDLADRTLSIIAIRQAVSGMALSSVLTGIFSIFNYLLLWIYDGRLALVATGMVLISVAVTFALGRKQVSYERRLTLLQAKISGLVLQIIDGIAKFRVTGSERRAFYLWAREFSQQRRITFQVRSVENLMQTFQSFFPVVTSMVLFFAFSSEMGSLSTGRFMGFVAAFTVFNGAMMELSMTGLSLLRSVPHYEKAKPILETLPEVDEGKEDPGDLVGAIEISRLWFRYIADGPPIIQDLTLNLNPGELVAFVGPSGCGKSTLLRLLLGFETPESGALYFDGRDLASLDLRSVRSQIGVVLQNGQLSNDSIFTNIVGSSTLTLEDAWEAARMAGLDHEIQQMPMGMNTVVGHDGGTLSGGQRQRLLIARALVRKPRIVVFDEATSALDNRTQRIVTESLNRMQATRIVIAHRLSTIRSADRIVVLDKGQVVQSGTFEELMDQAGPFAELARRQMV